MFVLLRVYNFAEELEISVLCHRSEVFLYTLNNKSPRDAL